MRRFLAALLGLLIGYPVFAVLGYFAISLFSGNHFDGSVEASMTAAFVFGPAGAIIGLIAGIVVGKKEDNAGLSSSCPALCRASTSYCAYFKKYVDGRDKPGHDGRPIPVHVVTAATHPHRRKSPAPNAFD